MDRPERFILNRNTSMGRALYGAPLALLGRGACNSGMAWDSGFAGNHGTLTNFASPYTATSGPVWVSELGRWGWAFDGNNDNINIPTNATVHPTGAISVSAWCNLATSPTAAGCVGGTMGASGNRGYWFALDGTNAYWDLGYDATNYHRTLLTSTIASNQWNHWCCTFTPSVAGRIYKNGIQVAENTTSVPAELYVNTLPYRIGLRPASDLPFKGTVADEMLFDRALTIPEIQLLASRDPMLGGAIVGVGRRNFVGWRQSSNRRRRLLLCS